MNVRSRWVIDTARNGGRVTPATFGVARCTGLLLAVVLVFLLQSSTGAKSAAEDVSVPAMIALSRASLASDLEEWSRYSFRRDVSRERLNRRGKVTWSAHYLLEIEPDAGGFSERLIEIDGRRPTTREVGRHRQAGRFAKHYAQAVAAKLANPLGDDLPLSPLLFEQQHQYEGIEQVSGTSCHRLSFVSREDVREASIDERLKRAADGSLCLSVEGHHLIDAEVESVRSLKDGLVRLDRVVLRYQSERVDGSWLPKLFVVESAVKVGPSRMIKANRYVYSAYRRR